MKILLDHNVNRKFRRHLPGHDVVTTKEMAWDKLANGELLRSAADAGFEALLTIDKKMVHEQNLNRLPMPIVLLDGLTNALASIVPLAPDVLRLLTSSLPRRMHVVRRDGRVDVL